MLIIDEVSFLSCDLIEKLDKHMRSLKEVSDEMFGGIHVVFVGDFSNYFQLEIRRHFFNKIHYNLGLSIKPSFLTCIIAVADFKGTIFVNLSINNIGAL